jgi:colanic acid/amylovoran biosynthesis protein
MKILILNLHSVKNAGDLVLNNTAIQLIKREFPQAEITVLINDLDETEKLEAPLTTIPSWLYWMKFQHGKWDFKNVFLILKYLFAQFAPFHQSRNIRPEHSKWSSILDAYKQADIVMSCPGNFLYTSGFFSLPFLVSCLTLQIALWEKKPLYILPQTIGPVTKWHEKRFLTRIFKQCRLIFVRDEISRLFVTRQLKIIQAKVKLVPDTAFASSVQDASAGKKLLSTYGIHPELDQLLGITTINWGGQFQPFKGQQAYEDGLIASIRTIVEQHKVKVVLFSQVFGPNFESDDRRTAKRIYNQLRDLAPNVVFISEELDSNTLKSAYGLMDFFVGSRLHSNIFALVQEIAVIAIQYQYKTAGIMTMAGLKDRVIKIEHATAGTLPQFIMDGYRDRESILKTIKQHVPSLKKDAGSIIVTLKEDYESI